MAYRRQIRCKLEVSSKSLPLSSFRFVSRTFRHFRSEDESRLPRPIAIGRFTVSQSHAVDSREDKGSRLRSLRMTAATSSRIRTPLHSLGSFSYRFSASLQLRFLEFRRGLAIADFTRLLTYSLCLSLSRSLLKLVDAPAERGDRYSGCFFNP